MERHRNQYIYCDRNVVHVSSRTSADWYPAIISYLVGFIRDLCEMKNHFMN